MKDYHMIEKIHAASGRDDLDRKRTHGLNSKEVALIQHRICIFWELFGSIQMVLTDNA